MLNSAAGRAVAAAGAGAAHDDELAQARRQARLPDDGQRQVGQRTERADGDPALRPAHHRLDDPVDGVLRLQLHGRRRQVGAAESGLAMDDRRDLPAQQRPRAAGEHLGVAPPGQLAEDAGVPARQLHADIAGDRRQPEHLQLRRREGEQDREGVVEAGVGVDDDGGRDLSCPSGP